MNKPSIIRPAGENPLSCGINIILTGNPGCGKTPLIATSPKCLIIDSDEGSASAAGSGADVWPATTWNDMDCVYEFLRHEAHDYEWVWWDGVSMGQDKLLEDTMDDLITVRQKTHRKSYLIDKGEYGENMMRIKQWVRHMKAQPFNFGITAHPTPSLDESTDEMKLWPWIQGRNMPQSISAHFDIIAFCLRDLEDDKLKLYVKETDSYYARDRFNALGSGIINPTIPQIESLVRAKLGIAKGTKPRVATKAAPVASKPTTKVGPRPIKRRK